ncbi:MAG: DUF2147 domain-containing protein [Lentisphaerae bacterium]|nr:DUF2147 domain-containing protein [Lentisphaerota bacterium]
MMTLLSGFWMFAAPCLAETDITGLWLTEDDTATVAITLTDEGWTGRIVALQEPHTPEGGVKSDYKNPDPNRRKDPIIGLRILWGFRKNNANTWSGGYVYDPEHGKTYHARMTIKDQQLRLRGSLDRWGLAGRSVIWTRPLEKQTP